MTLADRHQEEALQAATALVEAWIGRLEPERRDLSCGTAWTNQDLLGHLAAWSDLLSEQVEAIGLHRSASVEAIDIDAWNAAQVARRRLWSLPQTVADWRRSVQRLNDALGRLPPGTRSVRHQVAWASEPVSTDDVVRLWLVHIEQHRARLAAV